MIMKQSFRSLLLFNSGGINQTLSMESEKSSAPTTRCVNFYPLFYVANQESVRHDGKTEALFHSRKSPVSAFQTVCLSCLGGLVCKSVLCCE